MTQPGETDGYGAYEHVKALIDTVGAQFLDYVVVNDEPLTAEQLAQYQCQRTGTGDSGHGKRLNSWVFRLCRLSF
jgi:2-phospho-L-lactate transferase/gluconeogenesis factor (CofD/UPF0052 family)